ncbi:hypothetical protein [Henriciella aquimarina]|uniref:hypothetical protein n=1 Tax=Henriciella aquimarina TaxID=545261 RepID=UPI00117A7B77|nr:hypothetical protein [Henriciella aquimarina]
MPLFASDWGSWRVLSAISLTFLVALWALGLLPEARDLQPDVSVTLALPTFALAGILFGCATTGRLATLLLERRFGWKRSVIFPIEMLPFLYPAVLMTAIMS